MGTLWEASVERHRFFGFIVECHNDFAVFIKALDGVGQFLREVILPPNIVQLPVLDAVEGSVDVVGQDGGSRWFLLVGSFRDL